MIGVVGLQVIGFGAVSLLIPPDQEAGAVPYDPPLQVGRHVAAAHCATARDRKS